MKTPLADGSCVFFRVVTVRAIGERMKVYLAGWLCSLEAWCYLERDEGMSHPSSCLISYLPIDEYELRMNTCLHFQLRLSKLTRLSCRGSKGNGSPRRRSYLDDLWSPIELTACDRIGWRGCNQRWNVHSPGLRVPDLGRHVVYTVARSDMYSNEESVMSMVPTISVPARDASTS